MNVVTYRGIVKQCATESENECAASSIRGVKNEEGIKKPKPASRAPNEPSLNTRSRVTGRQFISISVKVRYRLARFDAQREAIT